MTADPKGRGLFIVDNSVSGWTGLRYLEEWAGIAKAFDIATGYFEIGALIALDGQWQSLDNIRILMGAETTYRTRTALLDAVRGRAVQILDRSLEENKGTNPFLHGVPAILDALRSGQIECRVYDKDKFHAKAYITHAKLEVMRTISRPKISGAISPPPYAQSSPPKPDAEASQSPPAAHRDDSLATNPSAGLVTEDHPSKRRRGGWGLAGVFAVVAWLAWLACPTAAFAQTNTISISSVAGDNVVTASEKWNGFKITGHTGNQSNIPVVVTFGTETWNTTSTTLIDGNYWWSVSVPGKSSYITDGDNQTVNAEATFSGGIKLSHSRTFNVDLTLPLVVDAVTGDDVINDGVIHITGDTGDIGSVRIDLVIGTGSFINASDLDGEWLQTVLAAENQSYITGSSASLSVTATKTGYEPSATVSRTLTVDLTAPSVSYTAPLSLQVGVEITPITPTTSDTDIVSYLFSNPLPGLSLNGVTGVISGTPTDFNASTRRSTVIATDAADNDGTATIDFPPVVAGTLTLNVDDVTDDNTINQSEHTNNFAVTGNTGTDSGVTVTVTIGGTALTSVTSAIAVGATEATWSVTVPANADYITETSVELSVTATKPNYTDAPSVSRTLTVDLTAPSVSYTAPLSLQVGVEITPITSDTDIVSYLFSNPLPGLSLNGVTGVISGTPTDFNASTRRSTVIATDAADNDGTATIDFPPVVAGTLTLNVDDVTDDNTINQSEHTNNFAVTGNTGTDSGVTVTVTIGGTALTSVTSAIAVGATEATWSVTVPANADYITETSVELSVTATKPNYTDAPSVSRTLTVDLTAPSVSYTAPLSLQVGVEITPITPTTSDTDIVSYLFSNPLPGLSLNGVTGVISGTPTDFNASTRRSTVIATDAADNDGTATIDFPPVVAGTLTLNVDDVTDDNTINQSEHTNNFAVTGNTGTDSGVTVTVTIGGTALTSVTSAIAVGATEATWSVTVPANADYITETSVELSVTATKPNYTDAPSVSRTLTVDLTAPSVSYTAPLSLQVGVEITPITPTTSEDIFSYAISGVSLPRGLSLNGTTGVISGVPTTGTPNMQTVGVLATDGAGNVDRPQITFPAVDGSEPGVTVLPQLALEVPEGRSAGYTVVLDTQPTDDVMIAVTWLTGSGSDTDLTASPVTLTFTDSNWNTPQTVTVSAAEDADGVHGIRNLLHNADSADSLYRAIPIGAVRAVEVDNDEIGVTVWPQVLRIPNGGSREYTVVLNTQPTDDVTITVTRDQRGDDDLTASPVTLTFTDSNWNTPQTVTVSAAADDDQVNGVAVFSHSVASNDENYQSDDEFTIASVMVTGDETRPRVEIQTEASAPVDGAFEVTIRFSEPVEGFELEDIRVTNGTASNFTKVSPQEYTAEITPSASGAVKMEVAEDVARDGAGNGNRAAEPLVIEADLERPEVTIAGPTEPVGMAGFEVTITFSEPVEGFELEDIRVTNGTASNFTKVSPQEYTAEITPSASGAVKMEVAEDVARDGGGNGNRAAEPLVIEADLERPEVTIAGPTEPVGMAGFEVTITFSEPVEGFELEDIRVTNGTASNFTKVSPQEYTAEITPSASGAVKMEVAEDVARDGGGNGNRAAEPLVIEADLERPEVTIAGPTEPVGMAGFEVTITFSEPVEGFELEDIRVTNGTASNFTKVSPQEYTAEITPSASGAVKMEVAEDVARDGAGNGNRAAEPLVIEADLERPEVTIAGPTEPVGMAGFEVTITFSEPVEGFELEDIRVTNGTASNFTKVSPQEYTAEITPSASGAVKMEVAEDVARDGGGNGNRAAEPLVIEADLERPEVTIAGPTEPVGMAGFEVTITFSEPVEGFELEDIRVTNGTASNFTKVSPQEYTAEITPSASGAVKMEVAEDVARDGAGNGNQAAEPLVIEADLERPEVTIAGPTEPVGMAGFEVTITFSEPVEGFELEDIRVTNGTASNFTKVSPQEYTAEITPSASGAVKMEVAEDVARDGAGNGNRAAEAFELETKLAVSYQEESYTAREGGETVTVTVKLSQGWDEELAIPIRVTRPETTEVADYTLDGLQEWDAQEGAGTLTFPAEETEQTFRIAANHDGDGDDETVKLGFGELPEIVLAGEPGVATVMLEDKGLVELKVSFGQAEYQIMEGQQADIEVKVAPTADRRVEVPLVVSLKGGASEADYSGVPVSLVIEEGESEGTISVEVLADEVNDPGEGIVLSFGELPEAVSEGEIPQTTVNFRQRRTAEQFSQTLEVALAVMARSMGESVQTAIEGRFERHRQWSRLGAAGGAVSTAQPGSDNSATGLGEGESQRIDSESLEGAGRRRAEGPVVPSAGGGAGARAVMGSSGESGDRESGVQGAWLQNVSLGGLAGLFGYGQGDAGVSTGSGMGPSGTGPTVGLGGQPGYGQNRFQGAGTRNSSLRSGSGEYSGRRNRELNLAGVSFEMPLAGQQKGTSRSWVPALWGQGDLQHFNGNLARHEMSYRGGLEAAHVGLDLYANDKVLTGLSFMRSWGNMDYSDDGIDGVLRSRMNTFHPYLYWQPTERVSVWGMGGLGRGRVDVNEPGRSHDFEADFRMFAGGLRTVLTRRGSNELGLRADAFSAQLRTEASEDIAKVRGEAHRARLMLEWVHTKQLSVGRSLSLKAEAGGRFDGGDADRGSGVETGFRLGYLDANSGLDMAMLGRVLVVHESDYRDWGLGVQASWDPGEKQRGFRVSVTSTRGQDGGGRTTLWNNANTVTSPPGMGAMGMGSQSRMESEVAYGGLKALGLPGLLTPYSRLRWAGQGRELAWGTAWSLPPRSQLALPLMLELEALRRENRTGPADLAVLVRMSIPF